MADYAGDAEETEANLVSALTELPQTCLTRTESRIMLYQELVGNKILALFLGLYLGITFLLAAAAVLALQQLSQGADNAGRYAILRRLGAQESMVSRCARGAGGSRLPAAAGPGPHSQRGGYEGGQRLHCPGGQSGCSPEHRRHRPHAAGGVRRLLPGPPPWPAAAWLSRERERGAESIKIAHWPPGPMAKF